MAEKQSSSQKNKTNGWGKAIRVGWFLAVRQLKRASVWTNLLIIFVMTLTFLNLVVVSGILVGLIEGLSVVYRSDYSGDVMISNLPSKKNIEDSQRVMRILDSFPEVEGYIARYLEGVVLEANYDRPRKPSELKDEASTLLAGVDPAIEEKLSNISRNIEEGEFLEPGDNDQIVLGTYLREESLPDVVDLQALAGVEVGSKIRVWVGENSREFTVKGILFSKVDAVSMRAFITDTEFIKLTGRNNYNVDEIAVKLKPGFTSEQTKQALLANGLSEVATVQTWQESQGKFFDDIKNTFDILGSSISAIGLAVASITIFIVIYINAISRKKYIGILKAIGVSPKSIEFAYILQSGFYAAIGSLIGWFLVYLLLQPYFAAHPIDFPFSDGILFAPFDNTSLRTLLLFLTTLVAGYVPARIVVKKNTLDAILGR